MGAVVDVLAAKVPQAESDRAGLPLQPSWNIRRVERRASSESSYRKRVGAADGTAASCRPHRCRGRTISTQHRSPGALPLKICEMGTYFQENVFSIVFSAYRHRNVVQSASRFRSRRSWMLGRRSLCKSISGDTSVRPWQ